MAEIEFGVCRVCYNQDYINADERCLDCYTTKPRPPREDELEETNGG